jgi:hypothetical protein
MKITDVFLELINFGNALKKELPEMAFSWEKVKPWEGLFNKWFPKDVPGEEAAYRSGVYLIADPDENILYIGKASANNLSAEIWGKFRAPTHVDSDGMPSFDNSPLAKWADNEEHHEMIIKGNVYISAAIIEPPYFSSLIEVYLQTWYVRKSSFGSLPPLSSLPPLNRRIG